MWTIYLNICYGGPSETIIKAGWRACVLSRKKEKKKNMDTVSKTCTPIGCTVQFISFTADFVLSAHRES